MHVALVPGQFPGEHGGFGARFGGELNRALGPRFQRLSRKRRVVHGVVRPRVL
tara:strand:+ start:1247 stop:1405 length:159 start_codon:yes stop_codon:yes gene_type:complete